MSATINFEAIGTTWRVDLGGDLSPDQIAVCMGAVMRRIGAFDRAYSRFRDDSTVSEMAKEAGDYDLPSDAGPMIALYNELYDLTDGAVTPMIGQTLVEAGYDASYSFQERQLSPVPAWPGVADWDGQRLKLQQPALLDFGAAGKGYLVDLVGEAIRAHGITGFTVDASGDMMHRSDDREFISVGLEHPSDPSQVIGVAELASASLCGSAANRRQWGNFHHIIDPHSLSPTREVLAVWVVAATTLLADGLSTALFFTTPERLISRYAFEYVVVASDLSVRYSPNFPGEVYS